MQGKQLGFAFQQLQAGVWLSQGFSPVRMAGGQKMNIPRSKNEPKNESTFFFARLVNKDSE